MNPRRSSLLLALVALLTGLTAIQAAAQNDFGNGNGHHGPFTAPPGVSSINIYTTITNDAAAGAGTVTVADAAGFQDGDLLMLWRPAGGTSTTDLSNSDVGRYELARILTISNHDVTLAGQLAHGFAAGLTQVVRIPEYTTVEIPAGSSVRPGHAWDGSSGGIVAFLATGVVTVHGDISANGFGFRGGQPAVDNSSVEALIAPHIFPYLQACLDNAPEPSPRNGLKGEGAGNPFGSEFSGTGSMSNGGGGGLCIGGGGGGGGNGGAGGLAGSGDLAFRQAAGGDALTYSLADHLTFGGGGGAGHSAGAQCTPSCPDTTEGYPGGGAIFIRAASLAGAGRIAANGLAPEDTFNATHYGGGGGGAGGSVYVRLQGSTAICSGLSARGGWSKRPNHVSIFDFTWPTGLEETSAELGVGGGGGGGRIFLETTSACIPDVSGGSVSHFRSFYNSSATNGGPGVVELISLNQAPTIDAGANQTLLVCPGCLTPVTLAASAVDPEGDPLVIEWTADDQVFANSLTPPTMFLGTGTHTFKLAVGDPLQTVTDTVVIDVVSGGDIGTLLQQLNDANATISSHETTIASQQTQITNLTDERNGLAADKAGLEADKMVLQGQLDAANETIAARDTTIAGLHADLATANQSINDRNATIATLEIDLQTANQTIAARNATIAGLESDLAGANQAIAALTVQLSAANMTVAALNAQVASLQAMLQNALNDPTFTIPGATPQEQTQNLIAAINGLNPGQKLALYKNLGGKKSK